MQPNQVPAAVPSVAAASSSAIPSMSIPNSSSTHGTSQAELDSLKRLRQACAEPYGELDLPQLGTGEDVHPWNELNEKQLRSALIGACKRMPRNAEAHFHLGLMYMRLCDGEEALRAFQHCLQIYSERMEPYSSNPEAAPPQLKSRMATLRAHTAQAAHLAAAAKFSREERSLLLERLQKDLVTATNLDNTQPQIWNALALLHLNEDGYEGAREVLRSIRGSFPEYLDALNNLGLAELALGNAEAAITCFQKVIVLDRGHAEALSNYGLVLLRHSVYEAAARAFEGAVKGTHKDSRGLSFAWGGLAIANAAMGKYIEAENAARDAERAADTSHKQKFALLLTSIRARRVTEELRKGTASDHVPGVQHRRVYAASPSAAGLAPNDNLDDPRLAMDSAVLKLRALSREIGTSYSSTSLGAALRIRHDFSWEETGNRNFGAEAAERLVEALEKDNNDAAAWVQLALLQLGTGRYTSSRDFSVQAVSRNENLESAWNTLAVSSQLNDNTEDAQKAYNRGLESIEQNYSSSAGKNLSDEASDSPTRATAGADGGKTSDGAAETAGTADEDDNGNTENANGIGINLEGISAVGKQALAVLYCNIGNLRRQEGKNFAEAQEAYKKSLSIGGENAAVYNNLALLYISAERFEDAERMLDHALKLQAHFECAKSNLLKLRSLNASRTKDSMEMKVEDTIHDVDNNNNHLHQPQDGNEEDEDDNGIGNTITITLPTPPAMMTTSTTTPTKLPPDI